MRIKDKISCIAYPLLIHNGWVGTLRGASITQDNVPPIHERIGKNKKSYLLFSKSLSDSLLLEEDCNLQSLAQETRVMIIIIPWHFLAPGVAYKLFTL